MDIKTFCSDLTAPLRQKYDLRALKGQLQEIKEAAQAYEKSGLPAGHEYYQSLHERAETAIRDYCSRWDESESNVMHIAPFLYQLQRKAFPSEEQKQGRSIALLAWGFTFLIVFIGAALGLSSSVYTLVRRWLGA